MKRWFLLPSTTALIAVLALSTPPRAHAAGHDDQLLILSTSDVKGKTGPCGCHVPKGGLSRRAFFRDSVAKIYSQISLVDNGGFTPEEDSHEDEGWFVMDKMKMLGVDAVGTGANDLRFGYAKLKANVTRVGLPLTSANLIDVATGKPAFAPYVLKTIGKAKVGYFSLMNAKSSLGGASDSLRIDDANVTAKRSVAELRKQGANVVVLLSQLGNVESEDLVSEVPGIDVVICGRNSPVLPNGRMYNNTIAAFPGEQGHYLGFTTLTFGPAGKVAKRESVTVQLGPDIADRPDVLDAVKTFDTAFSAKLKEMEKDKPSLTREGTMGQPLQATPTPSGGGH